MANEMFKKVGNEGEVDCMGAREKAWQLKVF